MKKSKLNLYLVAVALLFSSSITNTLFAQCDPDTDITPPGIHCAPNHVVILEPGMGHTIFPTDLLEGYGDNCTPLSNLQVAMFSNTDPGNPLSEFTFAPGTTGTFPFSVEVADEAGNTSLCTTFVVVNNAADCNPDTQSPTAICDGIIELQANDFGNFVISWEMDNGSWDNCSNNLSFFITDDLSATTVPTTDTLYYPPSFSGYDTLALWVVDAAGNTDVCLTPVVISDCDSTLSALTQNVHCLPNIQVPYDPSGYIIEATDILQGTFDSCVLANFDFFISLSDNQQMPPTTTSISLPADTSGIIIADAWFVDNNGDFFTCGTWIDIQPDPTICDNDTIPPVAICDNGFYVSNLANEPINLDAQIFDDGSYDNCSSSLEFFVTLDGNLTSPPNTDVLTFPPYSDGSYIAYIWVVDEAGNASVCQTIIEVETFQLIWGKVFTDSDNNCLFDSTEIGLGNMTVRYSIDQGGTYQSGVSDADGNYGFSITGAPVSDEIYVELLLPNGLSSNCQTSYILPYQLDPMPYVIHFPIQLASDCDNMSVDVAAPFLRRCFPTDYTVTYCNNSAYDIDNVEILVTLPQEMVIDNVDIPYTQPTSNQLFFDIGTVASGSCYSFDITVILDCTTPLGATKCVQAEITPFDCQVAGPNWSGANLEVSAYCNEDTDKVEFTITNTGTGAMVDSREYIIIEDVIMYMQTPIQLGPGGFETIEFPANGSTWRLQIDQEPGHPSVSNPTVVVEGCTEYGSMGFVNQFSMGDADPYIAIDCQEVIGSYDPNDKQAFPVGYAAEHFIEPNVSLEYKIRFQNTGTDTAFTVRVEDQLSTALDLSTIQAGASSHPYRLEVREGGWLVFHFENILLPDSTTNEPASHGFVQFRVDQIADNPLGTIIENTADIYFDFNEAIQTNTTFHKVGLNFIVSSTTNSFVPDLEVSVAPNPLNTEAIFSLEGEKIKASQFELYDMFGRLITQDNVTNNQYKLQRNNLPAGTYIFRFLDEEKLLANGKVVVL